MVSRERNTNLFELTVNQGKKGTMKTPVNQNNIINEEEGH